MSTLSHTRMRLSMTTSLAIGAAALSLLLIASTALAGVAGSAGPTYPSTVSVGATNIPVSLQIINNSTAPQNTETVLVTNIFHTPSCATDASSVCSSTDADPGVFQVTGPITGQLGTACAGTTFTAGTPDATTGEVQFTPSTPVVLGSSSADGAAATCIINFNVNVLKAPTKDASANAGIQTAQLARVRFTAQSTGVEGAASGSSLITVAKATPTITTVPSAGGPIGTILNDTATLSGGMTPTGNVTFKLFAPTDTLCVGTPAYTNVDATAPYATSPGFASNASGVWHWSADYAGDANNEPASSPCSAEPVTVLANGNIIIVKDAVPNSAQDFTFTNNFGNSNPATFTLDDDTDGTLANMKDTSLVAGTYAVSEGAVSGWDQTSATCSDGSPVSAIVLAAGETVTCTFTNTNRGNVIIVKDALPNHAQDFTFTNNFGNANPVSFMLDDDADGTLSNMRDSQVVAGTYAISEGAVSGWTQTSATCSDQSPINAIVVSAGETVTCTFTNTLQSGHLIVQKTTLPAGDTTSFAIVASGNGTITGGGAGTVTDALDKTYDVTAGTYSVAETVPAGWTKTADTCQNVAIAAGETKTCLITNTKQGHVIIVKDAVPNNAQDFIFTNNFGNSNPATFMLDDDADGTLSNMRDSMATPGTYAVSEGAIAGWTQTSATCSDGSPVSAIVLAAGETVTCTFTNTLQSGTLIVDKITVPSGNTTSFSILASGTGTITGGGAGMVTDATSKTYAVTAGTYAVTETVPTGWAQTSNTCANVVIAAGETKTCVITNTQAKGHLIVDKVTNPAGNTTSFTILASGTGTITNGGTGSVTDATSKNYEVTAGTYSVTETVPTGWKQASNTCQNVVVAAGETKTCVITNDVVVSGRMTGGGSIFTSASDTPSGSIRVTHGFELHCAVGALPNNLQINWKDANGDAQRFHLTSLDSVTCVRDPNASPAPPKATATGFNTLIGSGTGSYNGVDGAHIEFRLTDLGEPGTKDTAMYTITSGASTVLNITSAQKIDKGNQQAHSN